MGGPNPRRGSKSASGYGPGGSADLDRGVQIRCDTGIAEVMGSNPIESPEFFRFMRQLLKIVQQVQGSYLHLISNTALHITFLS